MVCCSLALGASGLDELQVVALPENVVILDLLSLDQGLGVLRDVEGLGEVSPHLANLLPFEVAEFLAVGPAGNLDYALRHDSCLLSAGLCWRFASTYRSRVACDDVYIDFVEVEPTLKICVEHVEHASGHCVVGD